MFPMQKNKTYRSEKHLKWIRSKSCCSCGYDDGVDAHHIIGIGHGIMGSKESDALTIPLCRKCHHKCHTDPQGFDQLYYLSKIIRSAFDSGEMELT